MGHGKLKKFAENETFGCLVQPPSDAVLVRGGRDSSSGRGLLLRDYPVKGRWNETMFAAAQPMVLELGCGKGEYTIDLAGRIPQRNYVGVDIKGARLWKGAKYAHEHGLPNVAFLRTRVEFLTAFFAEAEVSEIWLTFSDPQMKSENSRLTSPLFLERYCAMLRPGGVVHLKTDSRFLHEYTKAVCAANGLRVLACTDDLYSCVSACSDVSGSGVAAASSAVGAVPQGAETDGVVRDGGMAAAPSEVGAVPQGFEALAAECGDDSVAALFGVQTYYERLFLRQGYKITYMAFSIDHEGAFAYPSDFDAAYWRSVEGPRVTTLRQGTLPPVGVRAGGA